MALAGEVGCHTGYICSTVNDIETVVVLSVLEGLPGFFHTLETIFSAHDNNVYSRSVGDGGQVKWRRICTLSLLANINTYILIIVGTQNNVRLL